MDESFSRLCSCLARRLSCCARPRQTLSNNTSKIAPTYSVECLPHPMIPTRPKAAFKCLLFGAIRSCSILFGVQLKSLRNKPSSMTSVHHPTLEAGAGNIALINNRRLAFSSLGFNPFSIHTDRVRYDSILSGYPCTPISTTTDVDHSTRVIVVTAIFLYCCKIQPVAEVTVVNVVIEG